jgi:hypothetical protein
MFHRAIVVFVAALPLAGQNSAQVEFNRDVRPILSDKCFICHGPDAATKKVPFRLDREEFAKADLGGGRHAIVEGNAAASLLLARITSPDNARRMPPAYTQQALTDGEIAMLRRWIEQGAQWEPHWSLIPPKRTDPPVVGANSAWPRNPIDRFILNRLEREKLQPRAEAPREILLRRASFDITGLPPTPAELDEFLGDPSPQAFENAVDRLLKSPRYGERMAARWLDAARYADTNGYQYDGPRDMWRWRDWVIAAFNSNKPYDRFLVEQLAGDLLPGATPDQIVATGFNRNHRINTEDGIVPEEYFVEQVVDRVETTSTVFLGLTLGCARCHNHKYDPLLQKDFYKMFAFFNSLPELGRGMKYGNTPPLMRAPTPEQQAQLDMMERKIQAAQGALESREQEISRGQAAWESSLNAGRWGPAASLVYSTGFAPIEFDGTKTIDAGDIAPFDISDPFTISAWVYSDSVPDGSVASRMVDNPTGKGYGVHLNKGHVHVNITSVWADDAIRVESEETLSAGQWHHIAVTVDGSRLATGVTAQIDGKPAPLRIENATLYRPIRNNSTAFKEPFLIGGGWGPERRFKGRIEDVRVYSRVLEPEELAALAVHASLTEIARKPAVARTAGEAFVLRSAYLETGADAALRADAKSLIEMKRERERMRRALPTVMVMQDLPQPRPAFLLIRGAYDKPGERVERAVPAVLPQLPPDAPRNRLGLAQWMVDEKNPLTARVAVNRLWQNGDREDGRGLRRSGRGSQPSGTAGLAGDGVCAQRVGREGARAAHGDLCRVPAIFHRHAGTGGAGPGEPVAGARTALPIARRSDPRSGAVCLRAVGRESRRSFGYALSACRTLERDSHAGHELHAGTWRRSVPAWPLYFLEAYDCAADDGDVRCGGARDLRRPRIAHGYADAGFGSDERCNIRRGRAGAGTTDDERRRRRTRRAPALRLSPAAFAVPFGGRDSHVAGQPELSSRLLFLAP